MTAARRGGVLGRLLVILVVVSLSGALAWATLANHRAHGVWSFHPLTPAWWSPSSARTGAADPFAEVAQDARRLAERAGEALWGDGGLIDRAEGWWQQRGLPPSPPATQPSAPGAAPTTVPPAAPAPMPTTVRGMLEQRFSANELRFAEGLDLAKRARPAVGDDAAALAGRMGTLHQARTCFSDVEHDLGEAIPAYEALSGHDPARLAAARQLHSFARQMLDLTRLTP